MKTIVIVLRSGGDFSFKDVTLIINHINLKWKSEERPQIICIYDKATEEYDLGNFKIIPMTNELPGTWSRIQLYSPEMEKYRPFLYIDLDTAIIQTIENIFDLVKNPKHFITLEDFYQKGQLATGIVWFPAECKGLNAVWKAFKKEGVKGNRMDYFLRKHIKQDAFWQDLTESIVDFKPKASQLLSELPENTNLVCFHGKPRIFNAQDIKWVNDYVKQGE